MDRRHPPQPWRPRVYDSVHAAEVDQQLERHQRGARIRADQARTDAAGWVAGVRSAQAGEDRHLRIRAKKDREAAARSGEAAAREPKGGGIPRRTAALVPADGDSLG